jgi:perosamine synthetase
MTLDQTGFQDSVISAVSSVTGDSPVGLHEPFFAGNEQKYVRDCIDSTYVSSVGKYVSKFEEALARYVGVKYAVAVVNGTSALHLALLISGVQEDDEVLVPSLSFVATANAVKYLGATPHFVDAEEESLGIDPDKLSMYLEVVSKIESGRCVNKKTGRRISAIVPMHTFGHASKMDELAEVARKFNLIIIEDAAEGLGTKYKGSHVGNLGNLGILSFNGNKIVTTGGGGAILTNSKIIAGRAKHLSTTAKVTHEWKFSHDEIAFNYRMPNLNAALGCAQLESLEEKVNLKRNLFVRYQEAFSNIAGVKIFEAPAYSYSNYWLQTLILEPEYSSSMEPLLKKLNLRGLMSRPVWEPLHTLSIFSDSPRMNMDSVEKLYKQIINIPSSPQLIGLK